MPEWLLNDLLTFFMYGVVLVVFLFFFDVKVTRRHR